MLYDMINISYFMCGFWARRDLLGTGVCLF